MWEYGRRWKTRDIILPFNYDLWRNIMKGCDNFVQNISFKVGDGRRVYFLGHSWCGNIIVLHMEKSSILRRLDLPEF